MAFVIEHGERVGYAVRKSDTSLKELTGDEFENLGEARTHFMQQYEAEYPDREYSIGDVEMSWAYLFDPPVPPPPPVLHYWPIDAGRDSWKTHDALLRMVAHVLQPSRWCIEEDMSGAWLWHQRGTLSYTGLSGYATPEWDGQPGIRFAKLDENGTYESDEEITLTLELTGDLYTDAVRIVLKVINQFERGY
jgi:hypothetical protein